MALVAEDRPLLQEAQAFEHGMDPYLWTRDYGTHGHVDLTVPPGEPRKWSGLVIRSDEDLSWVGVVVDLWTRQEGPSDLSLEADIYHSTATTARVVLRSLRVM